MADWSKRPTMWPLVTLRDGQRVRLRGRANVLDVHVVSLSRERAEFELLAAGNSLRVALRDQQAALVSLGGRLHVYDVHVISLSDEDLRRYTLDED